MLNRGMHQRAKLIVPTVIFALMVLSTAVPLNNAMADTHAWVDGLADIGDWYWQPDLSDNAPGMTSDIMDANYIYGGLIKGYADTLGTVKLYTKPTGWWLEAYARILDTYTFANVDNPGASGLIAGLYGKIDYSGTLISGNSQGVAGRPDFFIAGVGGVSLIWNGNNYTLSITGQPDVYVDNPVQHVSGSLTFPISGAYYGQPFDIEWYFRVSANNPALANIGVSADFYDTMKFSFYADGFRLGVTSIGGYSQGYNLVCECDLNTDGRCNMRDWLLFGSRWGATNCATVPCACDLNVDGRCNMRDWLIFGKAWGRTNCPIP